MIRAHHQTREFEETFFDVGLPYRIVGGGRFYDRVEIKDLIGYLRIIHDPDDTLALERVLNTLRGIGTQTIQMARGYAQENSLSLFQALLQIATSETLATPNVRKILSSFLSVLERWREGTPSSLGDRILADSEYIQRLRDQQTLVSQSKLENIQELFAQLERYSTLQDFLDAITLYLDASQDAQESKVSVITLHSAKGLEFDVVFLPGWEEEIFPTARSLKNPKDLEEERRLAYVGLTRARKKAFISYVSRRYMYGNSQYPEPSRFLSELPRDSVEWVNTALTKKTSASQTKTSVPQRKALPSQTKALSSQRKALPSQRKALSSQINIGSLVNHPRFGYGTVVDIAHNTLKIDFDAFGTKNIRDNFIKKIS